jgi:hypothetical protein
LTPLRTRFARTSPTALLLATITAAALAPPAHAAPPAPAAPPPTRDFASTDLTRTTRLAISALQDLGLALESADAATGTLVASRLDSHPLRLTITLSAPNDATVTATVLADYAGTPLSDPRPAEAFFAALAAQLDPPPAID